MPPKTARKPPTDTLSPQTLILDNGAYTLKAGLITSNSPTPPTYNACKVIPNTIARSPRDKRIYIGTELDKCIDFGEMAFRRPVEKGFIVNWEAEKAIWERELFGEGVGLRCDSKEMNLLLTEAPNCPTSLQRNCDEMVFEQFEFQSYYRCLGSTLNAFHPTPNTSQLPPECLLLIDTSHSSTTLTPLYHGRPLHSACRRLTIGGKLLTAYLKELSSIRHYNLLEETYLLNQIKESISYICPSPQAFSADLERTWKGRLGDKRELDPSIVVDYVLPDYEGRSTGFVRPHDPVKARMRGRGVAVQGPREDVLVLGNERFAVPELLFNPRDIGIQEAGIPEAIVQSLSVLPEALRIGMLANVLVVGGNSLIPGFMERLESELRALVPSHYPLNITRADDPIKHTWLGGAHFASDRDRLRSVMVSKAEYEEHGSTWLGKKFAGTAT